MKVIFGTTNKRKIEDLRRVIEEAGADFEVLSMADIGWDGGEIEETGATIEENSLIKARAILAFCKEHDLSMPIVTDDSGLFVDALNGEPGIHTARYGDDDLARDPSLPKYQCIIKLLKKMSGVKDRSGTYRCCVTCMAPDGTYRQVQGKSKRVVVEELKDEPKYPYFYSVFILDGTNVPFVELKGKDLDNTYRYQALRRVVKLLQQASF